MDFNVLWKRGFMLATVGWILLAPVTITRADVLWLVGQGEPIFGIVETSDAQQVIFRETTDGQEFALRAIKRTAIETMVVNHDSQKLASLPLGDWAVWLRLAEELDSQKKDPVARDLAMRLLVVVVANTDRDTQRRSAIESLLSLARSDSERDQLSRLRYLETGQGTIQRDGVGSSQEVAAAEKEAVAVLVRRVRLQEISYAELSQNASAKKVVSSLEEVCSWEELLRLSRSNRIDERSLRRLVELELRLRRSENGPSGKASRSEWHLLAEQAGARELKLPTIENVTEFDPYATQFVDGKWIRP